MSRLLRLSCIVAVLLALPTLAHAAALAGDLDHDGRRDVVTLDAGHRSLHVWLSASNSHRTVRINQPVYRLGFFDVDGDGRPELVISDVSARVHVWRTTAHGRLRPYAPRRHVPDSPAAQPTLPSAAVDDGDPADAPFQSTLRLPAPFEASRDIAVDPVGSHTIRIQSTETAAVLDGQVAPHDSRGPPALALLSF